MIADAIFENKHSSDEVINQISKSKINIYFCDSSGKGRVNLPIIIKKNQNCFCFLAMIKYTADSSRTQIRKIGQGIIEEINGKHSLFFIGIGNIYWDPRIILPDKIEFSGVSFIQPTCQ